MQHSIPITSNSRQVGSLLLYSVEYTNLCGVEQTIIMFICWLYTAEGLAGTNITGLHFIWIYKNTPQITFRELQKAEYYFTVTRLQGGAVSTWSERVFNGAQHLQCGVPRPRSANALMQLKGFHSSSLLPDARFYISTRQRGRLLQRFSEWPEEGSHSPKRAK